MYKIKLSLLICLIFFCFKGGASEDKRRVLDNFFNVIKEVDSKDVPVIENLEAKIVSEIKFSNNTLRILQPFVGNIFNVSLPPVLKSKGFVKTEFKNLEGKIETENVYLSLNSDIGSFIISKIKDNLEIYIPQLGFIISDRIDVIQNVFLKGKEPPKKKPVIPADFIASFFKYVVDNETSIREKIKMEKKTSLRMGQKTHLFNYPLDSGVLKIEIYDNLWTFASVTFIGNKNKTIMLLQYPKPAGKAEAAHFFPSVINLSGAKDGNTMNLELSGLKYNQFVTEKSFSMQKISFSEFMTAITFKLLQGNNK